MIVIFFKYFFFHLKWFCFFMNVFEYIKYFSLLSLKLLL